MFCRRAPVMPRKGAHCRARTYSLYAAAGIVADRDSPLQIFVAGGVPRAVRFARRVATPWPHLVEAGRRQQVERGVSTTAQTLRSGEHGGSGASPSLKEEE